MQIAPSNKAARTHQSFLFNPLIPVRALRVTALVLPAPVAKISFVSMALEAMNAKVNLRAARRLAFLCAFVLVVAQWLEAFAASVSPGKIPSASDSPPVIDEQPIGRVVSAGGHVTLSVLAHATGPMAFQWRKNGQALTNDNRISGVATSVLNIDPVQTNDTGSFSVMVTNTGAGGSVTSTTVSVMANLIAVQATVQGNTALVMRIFGPIGDVYRLETGPFGPPWRTNGFTTNYTGVAPYFFLLSSNQGSIRAVFDHMRPILYADLPSPGGPPGSVNLRAYGKLNQVWRFQGTTNFVQWDDIITGTNTAGWLKFGDGFPKPPHRFFRIAPP